MACPNKDRTDALVRGQLDEATRIVAQSHLAACASCHARYQQLRGVKSVLEALPGVEVTSPEWARIDQHILEAMAGPRVEPAPSPGWRFALAGALAVSVATGAVWLGLSKRTVIPVPHVSESMALAIAIGGDARTLHPPRIAEGEVLTAGTGSLVVQTAPETGVLLEGNGEAVMNRLRKGDTELTLNSGEILVEVKPLQVGESFSIRAGSYVVHVVGTAFSVRRTPVGVEVAVVHGRVRVSRDGDPQEVFISGGSKVEFLTSGSMGQAAAPSPIDSALISRFPLNLPDLTPEEVLATYSSASITTSPSGAAARMDGAERGVTPLTVIAAQGAHDLSVTLPGHVPEKTRLQMGTAVASARVQLAPSVAIEDVQAPTPAPGPPPAVVRRAPVARHALAPTPEVPKVSFQQAFHEAALGHRQEVSHCATQADQWIPSQLHLAVDVQPDGHVAPPVQAEEPGVDERFMECINSAARTWAFPAPGQSVTITIPYDVAR